MQPAITKEDSVLASQSTKAALRSCNLANPSHTPNADELNYEAPSLPAKNTTDASVPDHLLPSEARGKPRWRRPPRIALLMCDRPIRAVVERYGETYLEIFRGLLERSYPRSYDHLNEKFAENSLSTHNSHGTTKENKENGTKVEQPNFILDGFDVVTRQEYPDLSEGLYDGVLLTGSAASAYEAIPWIEKLAAWVARTAEEYPKVKLIGICFGHQVIARAMGGECVPNAGRWEVGTVECALTDVGKAVFETENPKIAAQQMHRDHVPLVPPSFHLLASSPITPVHGLIRCYPDPKQASKLDSPDSSTSTHTPSSIPNPLHHARDIHILTVQGHPEFTAGIVHDIINAREASGVLNAETAKEGRMRADRAHDGDGLLGRAIWKVLGVDSCGADLR